MELLQKICNTPGVSGFEGLIREVVKEELETCSEKVWTDRLGNLIALKQPKISSETVPLKVMIAAHMDEIGFMVKHIDDEGFIRFLPLGGYDPRTLLSEQVLIHGREAVKGIIAPQPNWILSDEDKQKILSLKELVIDTGRTKANLDHIVRVGDVISLARQFEEMNPAVVMGRNFDNRLGVYVMIEAMKRVREVAVEVYAVATVQEELGVRGSPAAAYAIEPDIGIAIDGSLASDVPYANEAEKHCFLGKGVGIYIIDNRTVSDPALVAFLEMLAERYGIHCQRNLGGGTDASAIQRNKTGAHVCTIGPPTRYMHSTTQLARKDDIEDTIKLLVAFLENAHTWEKTNKRGEYV
jgi:endoglucanase